jgi:hypothetical protein
MIPVKVSPFLLQKSIYGSRRKKQRPQSANDCKPLVGPVICLSDPATNLGVGRLDPFKSFPIHGNTEVDLLIDHSKTSLPQFKPFSFYVLTYMAVNDDTHASFKLFGEYWLPPSVQDPGAFQCTLALAARHRMIGYPRKAKDAGIS